MKDGLDPAARLENTTVVVFEILEPPTSVYVFAALAPQMVAVPVDGPQSLGSVMMNTGAAGKDLIVRTAEVLVALRQVFNTASAK